MDEKRTVDGFTSAIRGQVRNECGGVYQHGCSGRIGLGRFKKTVHRSQGSQLNQVALPANRGAVMG